MTVHKLTFGSNMLHYFLSPLIFLPLYKGYFSTSVINEHLFLFVKHLWLIAYKGMEMREKTL